MKHTDPSSMHWRSRPRVYYPMTMGLIQPEWLYMHHFFNEESEENLPFTEPTTASIASSPSPQVRINIRSRCIKKEPLKKRVTHTK